MGPLRSLCLLFTAALWPSTMGIRKRRAQKQKHTHAMNQTSFHIRVERDGRNCEVLEAKWGQVHRLAADGVFESTPKWTWKDLEMEDEHSQTEILDFWGPSEEMVRSRALELCDGSFASKPSLEHVTVSEDIEIRCLSCSGESDNRIDVVFMGDGYTMAQRGRFFEDMQRLTDDMFAGETFASWLPVFNIWAIHVPSVDSGIGYNGRTLNTPFGLTKQGEQHRAVMPSFFGQQKARETCKLADGCDYPSLIANDEFYGGLGGEFVIGTRSKTTGTIVLRHEMGHNMVDVGEEYDNGAVYRGVNSYSTWWGRPPSNRDIKWSHWLTEPDKSVVEQKMKVALTTYPWKDMVAGRQTFTFNSDGKYSSWKMTFTVSGYPEEGSLKVTLDGEVLNWVPNRPAGAERPDGTTVDRQFYYFGGNSSLSSGRHTLTFESTMPAPPEGPTRQLCSITVHEFGSGSEFNFTPGYIGAYPTWSQRGQKSFRPTNDQCLMRDMESTVFDPVCREGMWLQFLARMSLIDAVEVSKSGGDVTVQLKAVPLAHLRARPVPSLVENYKVTWSRGGREQEDLEDKWEFSGPASSLAGRWVATLRYTTSEVRKDDRNLLTATRSFDI